MIDKLIKTIYLGRLALLCFFKLTINRLNWGCLQKPQFLSFAKSGQWLLLGALILSNLACEPKLDGNSGLGLLDEFQLSLKDYDDAGLSFSEAVSPTLVFVMAGNTEKDINFGWSLVQTSGGGLNNDFSSLTGQMTLAEASHTVTLDLPLLDDNTYEGNETYDLIITNMTDSVSVSIPVPQISLLLIDNDPLPTVEFLNNKSAFYEGDGSSPVAVVLSGAAEVDLRATYTLAGSASGAGVDYTDQAVIAGQLLFPAGSQLESLPFDIPSNAADEGDRVIEISLLSLNDNSLVGVVGSLAAHNLYIIDVNGPLTVTIFKQKPSLPFQSTLPVIFDVIFNRAIDKGHRDIFKEDFIITGSAMGVATGLINGNNGNQDKRYELEIGTVGGDGSLIATLPAGILRAFGDATNTDNISTQGDTAIFDVDTPQDPASWSLSSPNNGSGANDLTPVVSATGIAFEENSIANIYLDSTCSAVIGTAAISGGAFSVNNISLTGVDAQDGLKEFYGQIVDVADRVSNCKNLNLSYTLITGGGGTPAVTINTSPTQADPTVFLPITFDIVFSEAVDPNTFQAATDITQNGTATVDTWALTSSDNISWTLTATAISAPGSVIPSLALGVAQNFGAVGNLASTTTSSTVDYSPPGNPNVPANFTAASLDGSVVLTWDACADCTYEVYHDTLTGVSLASSSELALILPTFTHTGLTNGNLQFYRVRALRTGYTESALTTEINAMSLSNICDTGDVESNCTITGVHLIGDNEKLSIDGDLTIANGGDLQSNTGQSVSLAVTGSVIVQSGGMINANFASLVAGALDLQTGSGFVGDITSLSVSAMTVSAAMNANIVDSNITNLTVDVGGAISANGRGSAAGTGTSTGGPTNYGSGGGAHGGDGGRSHGTSIGGTAYGDLTNPVTYGSGGAGTNGGAGGGVLKIFIQGTLTNNGSISADGIAAGGIDGGGAGGSLWIDVGVTNSGGAGILTGTGTLSASGGNGSVSGSQSGGGGGGGRLAIHSNNFNFRGQARVQGGLASGKNSVSGNIGAYYQAVTNMDSLCDTGTMGANNCVLTSALYLGQGFTLVATDYTIGATGSIIGNYVLDVSGTLTTDVGATLTADGYGYGSGPGLGGNYNYGGGGAGHGGTGGRSRGLLNGGSSYGSFATPTSLGSGGVAVRVTDSNGGGAIKILAGAFIHNGTLSADANTSTGGGALAGGGSGGSIWVDVGVANTGASGIFSGNGSVSVKGSYGVGNSSEKGGGGAGGRLAFYSKLHEFSGAVAVAGGPGAGGGAYSGDPGTFYQQVTDMDGFCDTGSMIGNDCVLSSHRYLGDGFTLTGTNLTMTSAASLEGNFVMDFSGNLTLDAGASIDANGFGFAAGPGIAAGFNYGGGGAGHGGLGGKSRGTSTGGATYGVPTAPVTYGSGGCSPRTSLSNGGGAIKIIVEGTFTNNGAVSVNGLNAAASSLGGGGSGGSIWIDVGITNTGGTGILTGSGSFNALGGTGNGDSSQQGGGGAGGRIALRTKNFSFTGSVNKGGGVNASGRAISGDPGTYYQEVTTMDSLCDTGTMTGSNCILSSNRSLGDAFVLVGTSYTVNAPVIMTGNFTMDLSGDLTLDVGATISANALGASAGAGAPGTPNYGGGGGGFGGMGGKSHQGVANGGAPYGSVDSPVSYGSGGSATTTVVPSGGGALKIMVQGTFALNGVVSANGGDAGGLGGGGSGGSVWIDVGITNTGGTGILSGTGTVTSRGGNGSVSGIQWGGGGGGGRVALRATNFNFGGSVDVKGGATAGGLAQSGESGSYYTQVVNTDSLCDTGTMGSNNCVLNSIRYLGDAFSFTGTNYTLGATGELNGNIDMDLSGDLTIDVGGKIVADQRGNGFSGAGAPGTPGTGVGGAGHGGTGGRSHTAINGGPTYGSAINPVTLGSGGGEIVESGSRGGGALKLFVQGTLTNNGTISANGGSPIAAGGGASGGSIWIDVGITNGGGAGLLTGSGAISSKGGTGRLSTNAYSGGGGGGRIALHSVKFNYVGSVDVAGGPGSLYNASGGDRGTYYQSFTDMDSVCDAGTMGGNDCVLNSNRTLGDGVSITGTNLTLSAAGVLSGNLELDLTGDLTLDSGTTIEADEKGYGAQFGPGAPGVSSGGGGAGHGGVGGRTHVAIVGGPTYGALAAPVLYGSGGGGSKGGKGGGALKIIVQGTMTNNGAISANAGDASEADGGGSGGSIWIDVGITNLGGAGIYAGTGSVSARGGNGSNLVSYYGGGGGGGRVAINTVGFNYRGTVDLSPGLGSLYNSTSGAIGSYYQEVTDMDSLCDTGSMGGNDCTLNSSLHLGDGLTLIGSNYTLGATGILFGNLEIDLTGDLTIDSGGRIHSDGLGFSAHHGTGKPAVSYGGGGGGHAGTGGRPNVANTGGTAYGNKKAPTSFGSGGGGAYGGGGGGALKIVVRGTLTNNGTISTVGLAATSGGGGGAGGSIWIDVGIINTGGAGVMTGTGTISVAGGGGATATSSWGGGGSGGRLAIYSLDYLYRGSYDLSGGAPSLYGSTIGDAGTFYQQITNFDSLCDSASSFATTCLINTTVIVGDGLDISGAAISGLTIENGGSLSAVAEVPNIRLILLGNFQIDPTGSFNLDLTELETGNMTVFGTFAGNIMESQITNLNIDTSGTVSANARGFSGGKGQANGLGPGAGVAAGFHGGGGGYGGAGGQGANASSFGGLSNGASSLPIYLGSGGASGHHLGIGARGGGLTNLNISNTLTVDGVLSASGGDGLLGSGGGSGGSIWVTANTLEGLIGGKIDALGGNGGTTGGYHGGGGSGGRVALHITNNNFNGMTSVLGGTKGGTGAVDGSLGTSSTTASARPHIIAVTSGSFVGGTLGGLAGAHSQCMSQMQSAGLGGTWKALLSTSTVDASAHLSISSSVTNLRGDLASGPQEVAANSAALWSGSLAFAANYDETGTATTANVWTGSDGTPTAGLASADHCSDWTSTGANGTYGASDQLTSDWLDTTVDSCANMARLYCVTQ